MLTNNALFTQIDIIHTGRLYPSSPSLHPLRRHACRLWALISDSLDTSSASELLEDLGVEQDTTEHVAVERGSLCAVGAGIGRR